MQNRMTAPISSACREGDGITSVPACRAQALAAYTITYQMRLRDGNPQIHGGAIHAGDQIRISEWMKTDH
jgi:hypothetical protein